MAIERRNPLPAGRYWIDISKEPVPLGTWQGFLAASSGFVHVDSTEDDPAYSWFLFTTTKPLVWPEGIGSPNIADQSVTSRSDTVDRPDPEPDFTDQIPTPGQLIAGVSGTAKLVVWVLVGAVVVKLLSGRRGNK
jgi:hypothetical protein